MALLERRTSARATSAPARRSRTPRAVVAATGGSTNVGAAPARDGPRGRDRLRSVRRRRDLPTHAATSPTCKPGGSTSMQDMHEAGGVRMRDEDAARRRLSARRLHDRDRQDARPRTSSEIELRTRPGGDLRRSTTRSRRPAAWSACAATSRPRAAMVKVAGRARARTSPARRACFDCEEDCMRRGRRRARSTTAT